MQKVKQLIRGFKLLYLNSIYFNLKYLGLKLGILIIIHIFKNFLYLKIKNRKITYNFFNWTKEFKLSKNYFKNNPFIWYQILKKNNFLDKEINILEIGSFEGMSILFYEKFIKIKNIYAVDPLYNSQSICDNFYYNIKKFENITFFKMTSDVFFKKKNLIKFDVIYIDGSHYSLDVYNDLVYAYELLNKDGIIFIDDFLFDYDVRKNNYKYFESVMGGIFMFLKKKYKYKILYAGHQLILKK